MFIILPLTHERMQANRLPWVTIGIVVINVLIFLLTHHTVVPNSMEERHLREQELVEFYSQHLYLEFPPDTYDKLSPRSRQLLEYWKKMDPGETLRDVNRNTERMNEALETLQMDAEFMAEEEEEGMQQMLQRQQEELDALVAAFEASYAQNFYIRYGYVPADGGIVSMFTSMFLHGGYMHLLFNMLFLWLSGCNIEDLWGRIVYPVFYLLGGIFATVAHGMMFPESTVPLIGASGAIAAVMGAFMIRMYNTKIYFVYFFWLMIRMKAGRFAAPAYVMLPLWFLQQLWEAFMQGRSSGVAFWAHIGGFVFGVLIALLMKVSGFEEKVLAPAIEKKLSVVDEHLADGIDKLHEQDFDGAIQELKISTREHPDDATAHGELSKAYFGKGDQKLALREFKRAVFLYMKQGDLDEAVDQYLDIIGEIPDMTLDAPQQGKIAGALEQRAAQASGEEAKELYEQAALAYKHLVDWYQKTKKPLNQDRVIHALTQYGDICVEHLDDPQNGLKAFQFLQRIPELDPEHKKMAKLKIHHAKECLLKQKKRDEARQKAEVRKQAQAVKAAKAAKAAKKEAAPKTPCRDIPLPKRLKLVSEEDAPAIYDVPSVDPVEANKVVPSEGGLDLKRASDPPIRFEDISVICVVQIQETTLSASIKKAKTQSSFTDSQEIIYADLFVMGKSRPYRIASNLIAYTQFFPNVQRSSLVNFRQFVLYIISHLYSVYVDQATLNFLKTGKPKFYSNQTDVKIHEKIFWKQLRGVVRAACKQCLEVYWIDSRKVPKGGGNTTCKKCGGAMFVRSLDLER